MTTARPRWWVILALLAGCGPAPAPAPPTLYPGPTIDNFAGRVAAGGLAIDFGGRPWELRLTLRPTGEPFNIPLARDGSFRIGWMPVGTYEARLARSGTGRFEPGARAIPGGLVITPGATEYTLDAGEGWKPDDGKLGAPPTGR